MISRILGTIIIMMFLVGLVLAYTFAIHGVSVSFAGQENENAAHNRDDPPGRSEDSKGVAGAPGDQGNRGDRGNAGRSSGPDDGPDPGPDPDPGPGPGPGDPGDKPGPGPDNPGGDPGDSDHLLESALIAGGLTELRVIARLRLRAAPIQ